MRLIINKIKSNYKLINKKRKNSAFIINGFISPAFLLILVCSEYPVLSEKIH